jgi:UDP-hydrolysing UDP-N-acetyl-D-glucosamine 2-epimerase
VEALLCSELIEPLIIAGGMACDSRFGNTAARIADEGFNVSAKLNWEVAEDKRISVCTEISQAVLMTETCLGELKPDAVMLLGDRYETLAIAQCATLLSIPIIHLHGGEETQGAFDNQIRHAITKLSHIHFVSCEKHALRVIQMGENPDFVFNTGAPGLDNMKRGDLPEITDVLGELGLDTQPGTPLFLITYHPPTLEGDAGQEISALLRALDCFDAQCIFTMPNSDEGGDIIRKKIERFAADRPECRVCVSALGEKRYWTVLKHCDAVLGNSSSGIIEAPAVPVPVVNIGKRQLGRQTAPCVINVPDTDVSSVQNAIQKALSDEFRNSLSSADSLYGDGRAGVKICRHLEETDFASCRVKSFCESNT